MTHASFAPNLTVALLAGGRATRLQGRDKAWTTFKGTTLVERTLHALGDASAGCLVSAFRNVARYESMGLRVVADRAPGFPGPLAGIDALLAACETALLLTVPVDLRAIPADLVERMVAAGEGGAVARDVTGLQPLVASWPVERARVAVADALARGEHAVHRVVASLALPEMHFDGANFGNLNSPGDFDA